MGSGSYSTDAFAARSAYLNSTGKSAFEYDDDVKAGRADRVVHPDLDPSKPNTTSPTLSPGKTRESRDSTEHPNATPIAVLFDETGSMGDCPRRLREKLNGFFDLVATRGWVDDPQVMFGAIGDGDWGGEVAPLQVGQFESDNRCDEDLGKIFLEGHGAGGNHESYGYAAWFFNNRVETDCWDSHGRKGYLFIIGDERYHTTIKPNEFDQYLRLKGDEGFEEEGLTEPLSVAAEWAKIQERWVVYFLHPFDASYVGNPENVKMWTDALGAEHYIGEVDIDNIAEFIGSLIGANEGADADEIDDALVAIGASSEVRERIGAAIVPAVENGGGSVVAAEDVGVSNAEGVERL